MGYLRHSILFLFISAISLAQNENRYFLSVDKNKDDFIVKVSDGKYQIQFYSSEIVETTFIPKGESENKNSHAIILNANDGKVEVADNDSSITITSGGVQVEITKEPFRISYSYKGKSIISEKRGYYKSAHKPIDLVHDNITAKTTEKIEFNLSSDEVLYGGGARALGMDRRGNKLPLFNKAHYGYETKSELMNFTLPIVLSSKQYIIHFDNAPVGYLDLDSKGVNTLTYETISGRKTYQVIVGDSWYDIVNNYTNLTGKQPMPPRWALGNFSSRFGYHSQKETENTISKFKEDEIPLDAVILDLYWFGKEITGTMGNLEFHRDSFPNPEQMIKNLRDKNVETILITEPFVLTTSGKWKEAVEENVLAKDSIGNPFTFDFYFGNTGLIDIYNPKGEQWFKNIYKDLADFGVTGFWGDLGEPEVHPEGLLHASGTANEMHNIYGHNWAELVYEANIEVNPNQRPFILMRAGYSGSQRFGMIPWSGDVNRTWGGLQSQPEIALQMGMQGLAYMHSDLGGFAGANLDDELYVRWLQYGVFQPIYRPHAQEEVPSEPVFRSDEAKALAKEAIELRYQLLPYNYNLVYENNQFGKPFMRPLFFEESDNAELFNYSKTYLWGNDILVSPVLYQGQKEQEVYFPKNAVWFDFYSNESIEGGQTKAVGLNKKSIPTYVRAGAFILMSKPIQSTKEYDANNLDVHYYLDAFVGESEQKYYNDDGKTPEALEKGDYEIFEFKSEFKNSRLEIEFEAEIGDRFNTESKNINLIIHNVKKQPKRIRVNGKKALINWNNKTKTMSVPIKWNTSEEIEIKIKLKK
ncbi:TIM-barrel domain-containing protein [Seonamhaeicola maritimus]|uniref:glycoside hydrolase family 31 protein n=1 Tax=Seonamhaeicola maritimus TaxID=2591822 RepID=UPI002494DEC6|nr:TIM-barrel domain-containing protein [Seonamhaeicola maritimus]